METLYEDKDIRMDCKVIEEYIDSFHQPNDPFFTKMIHDFHICFGCGYTQWRGLC